MLASHNSWTYLPSTKWWMKFLSFSATCQKLNIIEQYNAGVRLFDLRLMFKNNIAYIAHGPVKYSIDTLFGDLAYLNLQRDCIVRVCLDCRDENTYTEAQRQAFQDFCFKIECSFNNISFVDGRCIFNGHYVYTFKKFAPSYIEAYGSKSGKKIFELIPWLHAKLKNKKYIKHISNKCNYVMLDFIKESYGKRNM